MSKKKKVEESKSNDIQIVAGNCDTLTVKLLSLINGNLIKLIELTEKK